MKGEELGKLLLDGLLVVEDGRLVVHDYAHVFLECIHILADAPGSHPSMHQIKQ